MGEVLLGRLELIRTLGEGSFGRVFLAFDRILKKEIAVKEFFEGKEQGAASTGHEMEILSHLNHPALVKVYDYLVDEETKRHYFTQDFVRGETLLKHLKKTSWEARWGLFVQLLQGLEYLHQRGIIHLDIKPSNILVTAAAESPCAVILDFGIADKIGEFDKRGLIAGTFPYIAPEVVRGERVDGRADLYSLGMIFYRAFGRVASAERTDTSTGSDKTEPGIDTLIEETLKRSAPNPDDFADDVPPAWREIMVTLLQPSPTRRFWSANEVIRRINARAGTRFPLEPGRLRLPDKSTAILTGRMNEFRRMSEWFQTAEGTSKSMFVGAVMGSPGMGKTALFEEFRRWAELRDRSVVSLSGTNDAPADLFSRLIRDAGDPRLKPFAPYLKPILPQVFPGTPDPPPLEAGPDLQHARLLENWAGALVILLEGRRMVWLIDDLDRKPALAELLEYFANHFRENRAHTFILVSSASAPSLPIRLRIDGLLDLRPWSDAEARAVTQALLAVDEIPDRILRHFLRKTEGVPGALVEYCRFLVQEALRSSEDIREQLEELDWDSIAASFELQGLHTRELEGMQPSDRGLLEWISLSPAELNTADLQKLDPDLAGPVSMTLRRLKDAGWIRRGQVGFEPASVPRREAVLGGIEAPRAARMHLRIADNWALLTLAQGGDGSGTALRRANEFMLGGDVSRGFALARPELETMIRLHQPKAALQFLKTHQEAARALATPVDSQYRELLGRACLGTGNFPEAIRVFDALLIALTESGRRSRVALHLARAFRYGGRLDDASRVVREAKSEGAQDPRLVPALDSLLADVLLEQSKFAEAAAVCEPYLAGQQTCGDEEKLAFSHVYGKVLFFRGELDEAVERFKQNIAESQRSGRLARRALSLNALASAYLAQERTADAIPLLHSSSEISQEIGDLRGMALAQLNLGVAYHQEKKLEDSGKHYEKALAVFRKISAKDQEARVLYNLGLLRSDLGNLEGAGDAMAEALVIFTSLGMTRMEAKVRMDRAELLRMRGRSAEAGEECDKAVDLFAKLDLTGEREEALALRSRLLHPLDEVNAAADSTVRTVVAARPSVSVQHPPSVPSPSGGEGSQEFPSPSKGEGEGGGEHLRPPDPGATIREERPADAVEAPASRVPLLRRRSDVETLSLLDVARRINSGVDMDEVLVGIVDSIVEFTDAEHGFLLLVENDELTGRVARSRDKRDVHDPAVGFSLTVAQEALESAQPIITLDAMNDPRFKEAASVSQLQLRSVICTPLFARGRPFGAIYLDTRLREGRFNEQDLPILASLAEMAAMAIYKAQLIAQNVRGQRELRQAVRELKASKQRIEKLNAQLQEQVANQAQELTQTHEQLNVMLRETQPRYRYDRIVGTSAAMRQVLAMVDRAVESQVPVLLQGESGTGKELLANAIHFNSSRKDKAFVPVNCGAMPPDLFESELFGHVKGAFTGATRDKPGLIEIADGGTLFLDEIGEMPPQLQVKLLRVLQDGRLRRVGGTEERQADVRVVAATNRDLKTLVKEKKFREDLFYRLSVYRITLPPLRARKEDIPVLAEHFVREIAQKEKSAPKRISQDALTVLTRYSWPGNVRELENSLRNAHVICDGDEIRVEHLSQKEELFSASAGVGREEGQTLRDALREFQKRLMEDALERSAGNISKAAQELGVERPQLSLWIKKFKLKSGH